ncbi:hypothetical protein BC835DRAFT_1267159, partial [Cytidiella melzeri]
SAMSSHIREILAHMERQRISLAELTASVLLHRGFQHPFPFLLQDLVARAAEIHGVLYQRAECRDTTVSWAHDCMTAVYSSALHDLLRNNRDLHFNITYAEPQQIREFRVEDMAMTIWKQQPMLWLLIYRLVAGDMSTGDEEPGSGRGDSDDEADGGDNKRAAGDNYPWRSMQGNKLRAMREIKTVTILSQLLQSRYMKCNTLQSVMGIFLHSCNTPKKVIKVLACMGISVSLTSIHRAIHSFKSECSTDIQRLGCTLSASYAYDNFDVKFSTGIPTVDSSEDLMVHLTSGTLIRLEHGVTADDLHCADELWNKSPNNPHAKNPIPFLPYQTLQFLRTLHPEDHDNSAPRLTRRGLFHLYLFKKTLFRYGPQYFKDLQQSLANPDPVEQIPVCKAHQVPLHAMDINQSKVSGNIDALLEMLTQAGVGDAETAAKAKTEMADIGDMVQLVHGDLGTMERVLSAMERRAIDVTSTARLQFVVFVFGLFHLKMAAADALWRLLVTPEQSRKDTTSFMSFVAKLRPTRTGKLTNNATFREQHELINHVGEVLRLDAWRVEARRGGYLTLEKWGESKPSLEAIDKFAKTLASEYVEGEGTNLYQQKNRPDTQRDKQHENIMRTHHYLLLYEELSYAMNEGDIGRVETLFRPWIQIFRSVGKHKYATRMLLFMHQLYKVYPEGLR